MNRKEHLLACFAEECGEVQHSVMKALRFGLTDGYPGTDKCNSVDIMIEFIEAMAVLEMLEEEGWVPIIGEDEANLISTAKKERVKQYIEHARMTGALTE